MSVVSDDSTKATVSDSSLAFTSSDWNFAQMVTVSGAAEIDTDDEMTSISLSAASSDTDFQGSTASINVAVSGTTGTDAIPSNIWIVCRMISWTA